MPSNLLSKQWVQELEEMEPKPSILKVGGEDSDSNWKDELPNFTRKASISTQRIVVAVVNSASSDDFLRFARVDEHTLLVADEVHTTGANNRRKVLTLEAGGRLGLSATPERFRDEEGTNAIFDYFGAKLEPEFTLKDAQNSDPPRLVTYVYEPETLPLTPDEYQNWLKETETIGKLAAQLNKSPSQDLENKLQMALIRRSRIIKSAAAKSDFAITCLVENFEEGQRWLVYCDTQEQLEEIKIKIGNELSLSGETSEYTSSMYFDKEATISIFGNRGGILLAIKCLDEGVDIPSITHALILASSLNPREHIQRRGRVLRTAPGKTQAVIYDALISPTETEPNSVLPQDLERAKRFAEDASNVDRVKRTLQQLKPFGASEKENFEEIEEDENNK